MLNTKWKLRFQSSNLKYLKLEKVKCPNERQVNRENQTNSFCKNSVFDKKGHFHSLSCIFLMTITKRVIECFTSSSGLMCSIMISGFGNSLSSRNAKKKSANFLSLDSSSTASPTSSMCLWMKSNNWNAKVSEKIWITIWHTIGLQSEWWHYSMAESALLKVKIYFLNTLWSKLEHRKCCKFCDRFVA